MPREFRVLMRVTLENDISPAAAQQFIRQQLRLSKSVQRVVIADCDEAKPSPNVSPSPSPDSGHPKGWERV